MQNTIAYLDNTGGTENIWLVKGDGTSRRQLTENGGASPAWMPDAKSIIYVQGPDIYLINTDTKEKDRLTFYFRAFYPVIADVIPGPKTAPAGAEKK